MFFQITVFFIFFLQLASAKYYAVIGKRNMNMSKKIYVGNLNYATTEDTLKNSFASFGEVLSSVVIKDRFTEQSKGFGFVEMADDSAADAAIAALFVGIHLRVRQQNLIVFL